MKQSDEHSQGATRVPFVLLQPQCASTVSSLNSDDAKEAVGISQFDEEGSSASDDSSEDRLRVILSKLEPKKRVGLWSRTISSLARVMSADRSLPLKFQQKIEESDVKPTLIPYNDLRVATRDFHKDMMLGQSASGPVYKGMLPNECAVAVKRSQPSEYRPTADEFWNEVLLFTGIKHKNLVPLKGCCLHDQQWLRVYEYVEGLNVSQILLDKGPHRQLLTWPVRLKICLGVAQGLHYLHALAHPRIIHRNITAKHVFLDRNLNPKIGGFRYSFGIPDENSHIVMHEMMRAGGYMAPDIRLSKKADVYSFGVLCLEIISGRRNTNIPDQESLLEWARLLHEEGRLLEFIDPALHLTDVEVRAVQRVIEVCLMCVQDDAKSRPSMARIVSILQGGTRASHMATGGGSVRSLTAGKEPESHLILTKQGGPPHEVEDASWRHCHSAT